MYTKHRGSMTAEKIARISSNDHEKIDSVKQKEDLDKRKQGKKKHNESQYRSRSSGFYWFSRLSHNTWKCSAFRKLTKNMERIAILYVAVTEKKTEDTIVFQDTLAVGMKRTCKNQRIRQFILIVFVKQLWSLKVKSYQLKLIQHWWNLMPIIMYKCLFSCSNQGYLERSRDHLVRLEAYKGSEIRQYSRCNVNLKFKNKFSDVEFYVIDHVIPLVILPTAEALSMTIYIGTIQCLLQTNIEILTVMIISIQIRIDLIKDNET